MTTIIDTIGNTPLVEISKINPNPKVKIYAKLEGFNPSGSMKDRVALAMIEDAQRTGILKPGKTIIETSNGNTGISLAMIAAAKGYPAIIVAPETIPDERKWVIKNFGAQLILVKPEMWRQGAMNLISEMAAKDNSLVILNQITNEQNCITHFRTTGKEILKQLDTPIDYFISCIGTGGTISGIARQLRQKYPQVRVIGIQPKIWGIGSSLESGITPQIIQHNLPCANHEKVLIDTIVEIDETEAQEMAKRIIAEEGIFAGASSGAALLAACHYAQKIEKGTIVTIFPDRGANYLSTEIFKS